MNKFILLCMVLCTGCVSFPKLHPHLITLKNNVCTYYPVIKQDSCSVTFGPGQEKPLSACDGYFAVPPEDVTALLEWQKQQCGNSSPKPNFMGP